MRDNNKVSAISVVNRLNLPLHMISFCHVIRDISSISPARLSIGNSRITTSLPNFVPEQFSYSLTASSYFSFRVDNLKSSKGNSASLSSITEQSHLSFPYLQSSIFSSLSHWYILIQTFISVIQIRSK